MNKKQLINKYGNQLKISTSKDFLKYIKKTFKEVYPIIANKCTYHNEEVSKCKCNHIKYTKRKEKYTHIDLIAQLNFKNNNYIYSIYRVEFQLNKNKDIEMSFNEIIRIVFDSNFVEIVTLSKRIIARDTYWNSFPFSDINNYTNQENENDWRIATNGVHRHAHDIYYDTYYNKSIKNNDYTKYINIQYMKKHYTSFSYLKKSNKNLLDIKKLEYVSKLGIDIEYVNTNNRFTSNDLYFIKKYKILAINYNFYKMFKKEEDIDLFLKVYDINFQTKSSKMDNIKSLFKYFIKELNYNYLINNMEKINKYFINNDIENTIHYIDYLESLKKLSILNNKEIFAKDFSKAKEKRFKQLKATNNKKIKDMIKNNNSKAKAIAISKDLIIEPFKSVEEIVKEGKELNHCISGESYLKRYANKETLLLKVRKKDNLNKPYYSIEISDNKLKQVSGYNNNINYKEEEKTITTKIVKKNLNKILKEYI